MPLLDFRLSCLRTTLMRDWISSTEAFSYSCDSIYYYNNNVLDQNNSKVCQSLLCKEIVNFVLYDINPSSGSYRVCSGESPSQQASTPSPVLSCGTDSSALAPWQIGLGLRREC
jgi:hypothetical protein